MAFIRGEGRMQGTMFPVTLDELIPEDQVCRVIDLFVERLDMAGLGFDRAEPADTGRPGYDPRDLLLWRPSDIRASEIQADQRQRICIILKAKRSWA